VLAAVDASDDHETLGQLLRGDADLLETARTPLMLRLLMQTYRGITPTDLARDGLADSHRRHEYVVDAYTQLAFDRAEENGTEPVFDEDATISALSMLAQMMQTHSQGIFLIERLQPGWIIDRRWTSVYLLGTRLGGGLIIGLILGMLFEISLTLAGGGVLPSGQEAVSRLLLGLTIGLGGGVIVAVIDVLRYRLGSPDLDAVSTVMTAVAYLLTFGGLAVLIFAATLPGPALTYGLITGLSVGLLFWIYFGLPARGGLQSDIRMVETLVMDRKAAIRNFRRGALAGAIFGLSAEALLGMAEPMDLATRIIAMLLVGLAGALIGGVVGGALGGLRRGYVRSRSRPNEGFRLTLRNMWLAGGVVAGAAIAVFVPLLWLGIGGAWGVALGITAGVGAGAMAALGVGGMDALRHVVLRMVLRRSGKLPSPLIDFLNYSAEIGFLQRAGGAYLFIHNVVRDYFAAYYEASAPTDQNRISIPAAGAMRPSLAKKRSPFA
jgi:eukaryotic-like serine/threonine-protein kinase